MPELCPAVLAAPYLIVYSNLPRFKGCDRYLERLHGGQAAYTGEIRRAVRYVSRRDAEAVLEKNPGIRKCDDAHGEARVDEVVMTTTMETKAT